MKNGRYGRSYSGYDDYTGHYMKISQTYHANTGTITC